MIFHRKPKTTEIEPAQYALWLRAQRPPFDWFMRQPALVQQALANEGDAYIQDCIALGSGVAEDEEQAAMRLAGSLVSKLSGAGNGPTSAPPVHHPITMAGVGERRREAEKARQDANVAGRSLFGREPDASEPAPTPHQPRTTEEGE